MAVEDVIGPFPIGCSSSTLLNHSKSAEDAAMLYASVVVTRTNTGNSKANEYQDGVLNGLCMDHGRYKARGNPHKTFRLTPLR